MKRNDQFDKWLKTNLEEETKRISFSAQAKDEVRRKILLSKQTEKNSKQIYANFQETDGSTEQDSHPRWWQQEVSLSLKAVSFCLALLLVLGAFYTRTFFYVSPQHLAKFETREKVILYDEGVPFGAMQHLVASLGKGKGVDRP